MRRRHFSHWASANYGNEVTTLTNSRVDWIDTALNFAWSYFVNVLEAQTESGAVARMMSSRSLAKPSRSQILPGLFQAQAK